MKEEKMGEEMPLKKKKDMVRIHEGARKVLLSRRGGALYKYPKNLGGEKEKK